MDNSLSVNWSAGKRLFGKELGVWWMSGGAYAFMPLVESGNVVRFFACGRDDQGRSRIGTISYKWGSVPQLLDVSSDPVLDLGEAGCFDMDGVAYPYLVRDADRLLLYYVGWTKLGGRVPWVTNLGLAVSDDNGTSFVRAGRAPIIARTNDDPIGSASSCIVQDGKHSWTMYYSKMLSWSEASDSPQPFYNIWKARSSDGMVWTPDNENVIGHEPGEYALCAPCLHKFGDQTVMFFTARGDRYRLFPAIEQPDGTFRRSTKPLLIKASEWDDDMQCYCHVVTIEDEVIIFYCGNGYGREGVGYARWLA